MITAEGHGIGIWLEQSNDFGTMQVQISESLYVALQFGGFVAAVVAGLITAWLVLP